MHKSQWCWIEHIYINTILQKSLIIIDSRIKDYDNCSFDIAIISLLHATCTNYIESNAVSLHVPDDNGKKSIDLGFLIAELKESLANDWLEFGIHLGLKIEELECIEANHPANCQKCAIKLLISWWKQQQSPSWDQIVQALKKIGNERLASTISKKYLTTKFQETAVWENKTDIYSMYWYECDLLCAVFHNRYSVIFLNVIKLRHPTSAVLWIIQLIS